MNTPINRNAPVKSRLTVEMEAPLAKVWALVTDIPGWPRWQKAVTQASLEGELAEGTPFRWKAGGILLRSQLHTVKENAELGWTGKTIGTFAIHNWLFEERHGRTFVTVEESLQGFFPALFRRSFQRQLDTAIRTNLRELKWAAENEGQ